MVAAVQPCCFLKHPLFFLAIAGCRIAKRMYVHILIEICITRLFHGLAPPTLDIECNIA
jgi:hypothetical protein